MIIAIIGVMTLAVLIQQLSTPTRYRSVAHVQVELIDELGTNQADVDSRNAQRVANAVRLQHSRSTAERVIKDLNLLNDPDFKREMGNTRLTGSDLLQSATNTLMGMLSINSEPNSDLIQIEVTSRSPKLAARIANQLPISVGEVRDATSIERRKELLASLEGEMAQRSKAADEAAQKVADFRRQKQMLVGAGGEQDLSQLDQLVTEAASARAKRDGSAAHSAGVAAASSMSSTAQATSVALDQLESKKAQLVAEQSNLAAIYGPNHPDMKRVNAQLATVNSNIAIERKRAQDAAKAVNSADAARMQQLAQSEASRDAATAARLSGIAASVKTQAYRNVANSVELSKLVRASTLADQAYNAIADRVEKVRAQMQMQGVSSSIVSPAVPNFDPVAPAPVKMTVFAFIGSGILAFLIAFLRDFLDDRLRTSAQIRRLFGLPTFGMVPLLPVKDLSDDPTESPVLEKPQSLFAEVARSAYCDVRALAQAGKSQVILLTSPLPGDGKSTISLTLAAAGIAMGDRTLVLDLDLRKRGLLQQLQDKRQAPDLLDVVTGEVDLDMLLPPPRDGTESVIPDDGSHLDHITLLSTRRPVNDPVSLLTSRRLTDLLADLRTRFDLIIINAPATLAVRDARAMCHFADQTVMVSRWDRTTAEQMNASLELLGYQAAGVIFDGVDYAEHARCKYGDSVQFYVDSSEYYSDPIRRPPRIGERLKAFLARFRQNEPAAEAA